tara:strand:+ start:328 stop:522 length:195 start_codon:yes stop_codon:yes gene_type:complete
MNSLLYNQVKENIEIINDKDESYLIRSLLREELENIRNLLNKEYETNEKIWKLQKRELSDNGEK